MVTRKLSAPNSKLMAAALLQASSFPAGAGVADAPAMPFTSAQDLCDRLMQCGKTGHMLVGREDEPWAALLPFDMVSGRFSYEWCFALQTEIMGRGLDGIVVSLEGGMVVKVNKLHPSALKQCSTEECRRSMVAESEERFKKEVNYLLKHQNCRFVVPALPVMYVEGENSQRLGYLMPELKSLDKFEWPNESLALQVFRRLVAILCFFRKSKVVYSDFKPENILLQEVSGGDFVVKLNDFGFADKVGGDFLGGTDEYMPWKYLRAKRFGRSRPEYPPLDYALDTFAVRRIVLGMWGCDEVVFEVVSEVVKLRRIRPRKWLAGIMEWMELESLQLHGLEPTERGMMQEVSFSSL